MKTNNLGYPRIGNNRELKKACESYWAGKSSFEELKNTGKQIRQHNWKLQQSKGIDVIPSNDFSFYDHVLDMSFTLGAIPKRYEALKSSPKEDLYFAMARGYQKSGLDLTAMEMTKWFDTNYHYIVPEFTKDQNFSLFSTKAIDEYLEAKALGIKTKPVLLGPITYLLLGKEKGSEFDRLDLIEKLLPVYLEILKKLSDSGAEWVQLDEPFLVMDLSEKAKKLYSSTYRTIADHFPKLHVLLATYFDTLGNNTDLAMSLPVSAIHVDLIRGESQLNTILKTLPKDKILSAGVVDGRNIWKNDFEKSIDLISQIKKVVDPSRIMIASSCSMLHSPCSLQLEDKLNPELKNWMAFSEEKLGELSTLKRLLAIDYNGDHEYKTNRAAMESRKTSKIVVNPEVRKRIGLITANDSKRKSPFDKRKDQQQKALGLPLFPTTTIGSFPQTPEVRSWRAQLKSKKLSQNEYDTLIKKEITEAMHWQESIDVDVLVHGEFERNDMVEYFGENLSGFAFTKNGWVQSYGSRCVKPPVIYGDVCRPEPMTVFWTQYAQTLTKRPVKGMLTGPVTILQWSFVRNDQPRKDTCNQIALAIRDEVLDLEKAGIKVIQIDEPALREGLPLRKANWDTYLDWSVTAFRLSVSGVKDETQIHTHMCYSEFNDIIQSIADMDADVITIECSRSQMDLLDAFVNFKYPNEIGPGVYDIHSPRVPSVDEMLTLMEKAVGLIPAKQLWVNPDCGLKTRHWPETKEALSAMVAVAKKLRAKYA